MQENNDFKSKYVEISDLDNLKILRLMYDNKGTRKSVHLGLEIGFKILQSAPKETCPAQNDSYVPRNWNH